MKNLSRLPRVQSWLCHAGAGLVLLGSAAIAKAIDYTYVGPNNGVWSLDTNWSPTGVPTTGDTVTIGAFSTTDDISVSLNDVTVTNGAGGPTTVVANGRTLTLTGAGVHGSGTGTPDIVVAAPSAAYPGTNASGHIVFNNSASAMVAGSTATPFYALIGGNSTPTGLGRPGATITFNNNSMAGAAFFNLEFGLPCDPTGCGGTNGAVGKFTGHSSGDTSQWSIQGQTDTFNGQPVWKRATLDITSLTNGGTTVGGIDGGGFILLGGNTLTVGSLNFDNNFSGLIDGPGGSITKTGTGTFTVSNNTLRQGGFPDQ